jgi:ABC-type multidrug transport system ATPase subunit
MLRKFGHLKIDHKIFLPFYIGLDSSSAKDVVSCLHDIAKMGITVVAVLHQPRYEILSLCDDLLLLGKGNFFTHFKPW